MTDELCSWKFYEKVVWKKAYETIVENKEYGKLDKYCKITSFYILKEILIMWYGDK